MIPSASVILKDAITFKMSMHSISPVKLLWGTFCRYAIVDERTKELTLIGVLPAITIQTEPLPPDASSEFQKRSYQLSPLYLCAIFEKTTDSTDILDVAINIVLTGGVSEGRGVFPLEIEAKLGQCVIDVSGLLLKVEPTDRSKINSVDASFYYEENFLASVSMPTTFTRE
jgi:hypothetical protein